MEEKLSAAHARTKPKLLEVVCDAIRFKPYSIRTEESYLDWVRRFILFHGKRHPKDMGEEEVRAFKPLVPKLQFGNATLLRNSVSKQPMQRLAWMKRLLTAFALAAFALSRRSGLDRIHAGAE